MKTNRIIIAALSLAVAVSCQKVGFEGQETLRETEAMTLVTGEQVADEQTRTSLSGNEVHWTADDVVAVFDNTNYKNKFTITEVDRSYASFSGVVTDGTTQIYAVYPYSLAMGAQGSTLTVKVPEDQTSKVGSFAEEHNISVAKASKTRGVEVVDNITFKNVCSYLKFTIPTYVAGVSSVTLSTKNRNIAGEATIDFSGDEPVLTLTSNAVKSISMTGSYARGSEFLFVLAPGEIQGCEVKVVDSEGQTWNVIKTSTFTLKAGKYKNLGTLDVEPVGVTASAIHVKSGETLVGTDVTVNLNIPAATQKYVTSLSLEVKNSSGKVVRSSSSTALTQILGPTQDWPYLPQGEYTVSGSYKLGNDDKYFSTTFISPAPTFEVTSNAYTSYTKYEAGSIDEANSCVAETIYGVNKASVTIDPNLIEKHSSLVGGFTYKVDNGAATTEEKVNGLTWGQHTVTASYTFDGVTVSGSKTCYITGLPYKRSSMIESEWSFASWNCEFNNGVIQLGGVSGSGEASANSKMSFHIPATVNIKLNTNATVRALKFGVIYRNTDFTVSVNGTQIIKQNSNNKSDGMNYDLSGTTTISSGLSIKLNSSYKEAGPWSKVHSMEILYN